MSGAASAFLRAGLSVKLAQVGRAVNSYVGDRAEQSRNRIAAYAIGAGFYAAAGLFLISALLVGATALFRWVELKYGLFPAFAVTSGALVALMVVCVVCAVVAMRPKKARIESLGSRVGTAMRLSPLPTPLHAPAQTAARRTQPVADHVGMARKTASAVLRAPASPRAGASAPMASRAGIAVAVGLIGWALGRRFTRSDQATPAEASR